MSNETEFLPAFYFKDPGNAPAFVKLKGSIRIDSLKDFFDLVKSKKKSGKEWINFDIKESKDGKIYASIDNWEPTKENLEDNAPIPTEAEQEDLPF